MFDLLIRDANIYDGSGGPRRSGTVAVSDGRIVEVGAVVGSAREVISAGGLALAPGFIDVHTHFDVQGFWDPLLSPSPLHGITTAIGGNCGFSVAPLVADSAEYLMRMLARVEGMPLESLEKGVPWDWTTTAEFLDRLDGRLAINTGFLVGHSALRRAVMGAAGSERKATGEEIEQMAALLREGIAVGGLGFSSSWGIAHNDDEGQPVPSRWADPREIMDLAAVCREFVGTSLEFLPRSGDKVSDEMMVNMTARAARPLNWNLIVPSASTMEQWEDRLSLSDKARRAGGKIVGLVLPESPPARFTFRSGFALDALDGWRAPMALPPAQKLALLSDPAERDRLDALARQPGPVRHLADWAAMTIVETFNEVNKRYEGMTVGEVAEAMQKKPFDALLDVVCADGLLTTISRRRQTNAPEDRRAVSTVIRDDRTVVGGSDAGAHLDMLATFNFATTLLQNTRGSDPLVSLEEAVHHLTQRPADLYGIAGRGMIRPGFWADMVLFDPAEVRSDAVRSVTDLPGSAQRLYAGAIGVHAVYVNGVQIIDNGRWNSATPGRILRAGRDTVTPSL